MTKQKDCQHFDVESNNNNNYCYCYFQIKTLKSYRNLNTSFLHHNVLVKGSAYNY